MSSRYKPAEINTSVFTQLVPTIPLDTPKGKGFAHGVIDYGQEHHLLWVVFIDATGECWTFPNPVVRLQSNQTMGVVPPKTA
jgi:hypothetical protein